jgi:hypothetical protein
MKCHQQAKEPQNLVVWFILSPKAQEPAELMV